MVFPFLSEQHRDLQTVTVDMRGIPVRPFTSRFGSNLADFPCVSTLGRKKTRTFVRVQMVGDTELESVTFCVSCRRSNQLS